MGRTLQRLTILAIVAFSAKLTLAAETEADGIVIAKPTAELHDGHNRLGPPDDIELHVERRTIHGGDEWLQVRTRTGINFAWVKRKEVVALEEAESHFTELIQEERNNGYAYRVRAWIRALNAEYDTAFDDADKAVQLDGDKGSLRIRGIMWSHKKNYEKARDDFEKAWQQDPSALECNSLAWFLATCPEPKFRKGERAVKLAREACKLSDEKDSAFLDTLAAAYAETGDFESAIEWQEKAIKAAPKKLKAGYTERLERYKSNKPYHTPGSE